MITECFTAAALETIKRPDAFKEQELKDVLWSFSKVNFMRYVFFYSFLMIPIRRLTNFLICIQSGLRHPELFKSVAQHVLGEKTTKDSRLKDFSPQGIGNFVWSYARQAQLSNEPSSSGKNSESSQQNVSSNSSGRLAIYETICLDLGEDFVNRLFASIAECSLENEGVYY